MFSWSITYILEFVASFFDITPYAERRLSAMPGLDLYKNTSPSEASVREFRPISAQISTLASAETVREATLHNPDVYYNARLDPKNYLDGPLSCNPATRLRQMLARPGIVVGLKFQLLL
jgi:hypothetical protein